MFAPTSMRWAATLHYLLTGHAPFEAPTLGSLLARVLSEPAPSARALQPTVPGGLDRIVARCLAKEPAARPPDYASLHHALRPFSTEAPVPAPRPLRFAAGAIDHLVLFPVAGAVTFGAYQPTLGLQAVGFVASVVYFAILEGIWGASAGKWLCGLRVARATGRGTVGEPVGALIRAVLYALVWHAPAVALFAIDSIRLVRRPRCHSSTNRAVLTVPFCSPCCSAQPAGIDSRAAGTG